MNTKIRDSLFACMVVTVLFTNIPKFMQINFLFGSFSRRLTVVFVCIGLLYTVYLAIKKKMEFHHFQIDNEWHAHRSVNKGENCFQKEQAVIGY